MGLEETTEMRHGSGFRNKVSWEMKRESRNAHMGNILLHTVVNSNIGE